MGKLGKQFGGWIRAHASGARHRKGQNLVAAALFDDLWPFCFVPETGPPLSCPEGVSADLPSPAEQAAR